MFSQKVAQAAAAGTDMISANVQAIHGTAMVQVISVLIGIVVCMMIPKIYSKTEQTA